MIRKYRTQIRMRLALWHVSTLALVLIAYVAVASWLLLSNLRHQLTSHVIQDLETVEGLLYFTPDGKLQFRDDYHNHVESRLVLKRLLEVRSMDGQVLYRNSLLNNQDLGGPPFPGEGEAGYSERYARLSDGRGVQMASRKHAVQGRPTLIRLGYGEEELWQQFRSEVLTLIIPLPIILAIGGWAVFRATSRALSPIEAMACRAEQITGDRLNARLPVDAEQGELTHLARVFNEMLSRLERSFDQMRRFTSDASHELRTPLTAIRTVGEVSLQRQGTTAEYRDAIGSMLEEAGRLTKLVEDLLEISRAESASMSTRRTRFRAQDLARECAGLLDVLLEEKHQSLIVDADPEILVDGDWLLLRQAFLNIINNAIKYSPDGGEIRVSVQRDSEQRVIWAISDNGPGIAEEHASRIFDRFYRIDKGRSREAGGFGLGLAIAQSIITAHGGSISVRSKLGEGTTFVTVLPAMADIAVTSQSAADSLVPSSSALRPVRAQQHVS